MDSEEIEAVAAQVAMVLSSQGDLARTPTTLDYRMQATHAGIALAGACQIKFKSAKEFIKHVRVIESYLKEEN